MEPNRPCFWGDVTASRWRGRGCAQAHPKGSARKADFIAPTPLASARWAECQVSVPLRWASDSEAAPVIPCGGPPGWTTGRNAPHSATHTGDLADAGRRPDLGSCGRTRYDNRYAGTHLRAPSPRLAETRGRSITVPFLCHEAVKVVGVIGFEPTTPSSRTRLPRPKLLILRPRKLRISANAARTSGYFCAIIVPWRNAA